MKALTPPRLLVAPAALLFLLPSCQRNREAKADSEWWKLEAERVELAHRVELLGLRLAKQTSGDAGFGELKDQVERSSLKWRELAAKRDVLKQDIGGLHEQLDLIKSAWMHSMREDAVGLKFAQFSGKRGKTYEDAIITKITDVGVELRHAAGSARIAAADLSLEQLELFGLDAGQSGDAMAEERRIASAYESWVDERMAVATAEKEARAASAAANPPEPAPSSVMASIDPPSKTRLRDTPRSFGRGTTIWYSGSYPRNSRSYYYGSGCYTAPSYYPAQNFHVPSGNWYYKANSYSGSCYPRTYSVPTYSRPYTSSSYSSPVISR